MIPATFRRLLSRGDLPDSAGGLYNPGAWYDAVNDQVYMTVRHEEDYTWTKPCRPTIVPADVPFQPARIVEAAPLLILGFDAGTRCEDLRPFVWRDQVLISHVAYQPGTGRPVRQRLSRLRPDWSAIERWDDWYLGFGLADIEKNWALVADPEEDNALSVVYSLSPFVTAKRMDARTWERDIVDANDWAQQLGHQPRCSTHLLPWRGGHLGWWHCRFDGVYVQGAYWLDADLRLRRRTGILFDGGEIGLSVDTADVYKPGVFYLSSFVDRGDDLWLFYGVGDAHANVAIVKADDVDRRLR